MTVAHQLPLEGLALGRDLRDQGMQLAAQGRDGWLTRARDLAEALIRQQGPISADDLRRAGLTTPPGTSFNVFGSIFKDCRFRFVGYTHSERPEAHANLIRKWDLA